MARPVDLPRRTALLDRVVVYLGQRGLADVSFRPMARALGVSVNALVHHFGTKEELIAAALRRSGEIQLDVERRWRERRPEISQVELLRAWWRWVTASNENLAIVRLGIEAVALEPTLDQRRRRRRGQQVEYWRRSFEAGLVEAGLPAGIAAEEATVVRALFAGLVIDLIATGDKARLTRAFERHVAHLDQLIAAWSPGDTSADPSADPSSRVASETTSRTTPAVTRPTVAR